MGQATRHLFTLVGLAAMGAGLSGCVTSRTHNALKAERDQAQMELAAARAEAEQNRADAELFKSQVAQLVVSGEAKDTALLEFSRENAEINSKLEALNAKYTEAVSANSSNLPQPLVSELTAFASKHADLVEFDASRGLIRFKTDVIFPSGSSELTPKGREAVTKLAAVLTSKTSAGHELMIAGHTDSIPVSKPATIQQGHKDNWHLSAHRAIAVGSLLQKNNVHPGRMAMVGYADQKPVASNDSADGRAKNRRVELLVLPTKAKIVATSAPKAEVKKETAKAEPKTAAPQPKADLNKDATATVDYNK